MEINQILKNIGLTENESKVYLELLKLGEVLASRIAKETNINRSLVYRILESLKEKGLISFVIKENRSYFSAMNPNNLKKLIEEKRQDLEEILPELFALTKKDIGEEMKVEVFSGIKGLKTVLRDQLENVREFFVLGAGEEFASMTEHFYEQYYVKRIQKKITQHVLFKHNAKERAKKASKTSYSNVKILNKDYRVPMAIVIYGNKTALFSWPEKKAITITSKNVSEGFKEQFFILWKSSKSI